ncbi:MAG: hypothetical protein V1870_03555 [Candidatus Aenigmatarchaeota archaeon]
MDYPPDQFIEILGRCVRAFKDSTKTDFKSIKLTREYKFKLGIGEGTELYKVFKLYTEPPFWDFTRIVKEISSGITWHGEKHDKNSVDIVCVPENRIVRVSVSAEDRRKLIPAKFVDGQIKYLHDAIDSALYDVVKDDYRNMFQMQ